MSRKIEDLNPVVQDLCKRFVAGCKEADIDVTITFTYRTFDEQNQLYAKGRTEPGNVVTNAKGGYSYHNYHLAFDCVPVVNNIAVWDNETLWHAIGQIGIDLGLEWGGTWERLEDKPHFQYTFGLSIAQLLNGAEIPQNLT